MRNWIFCIAFLCFLQIANAQQNTVRDSLLIVLKQSKEDTNKVWLLLKLSKSVQNEDQTAAHQYATEGYQLSTKLSFKKGRFKSLLRNTAIFRAAGNIDSVLASNQQFLSLAEELKDSLNLGIGYLNIAESYNDFSDAEAALMYSLKGLAIIEKSGTQELLQDAYDNVQRIYFTRSEFDKAISYGEKSVAIARKLNAKERIASSLFNLSVAYNNIKAFDKAIIAATEVIQLSKENGNERVQAYGLSNLCDVYIKLGKIAQAINYEKEALQLAIKVGDRSMEATCQRGLAMCYLQQKDYINAEAKANEAIRIYTELNELDAKMNATKILADIAFATGDPAKGYAYELICDELLQKHINQVISGQSANLEKKYETAKKEILIKQLEAEKKIQSLNIRQKSTLNYILIGAAFTLLILSLLYRRNYKQKQRIQQQRIAELETLQQLTATAAVLKGEEQERTRMARDLHDGLGGMLSGIKYSFNNMKGNLIMTPENAQAFERSMDMLDSSIKEMRRVAHNMMPEALVKFGLNTALQDFCNDVNNSGALQINYQSIGLENASLEQTTAITIYRIVQELINNTMKHAAANTALVQVTKTNNQISVTVEDDGKGFDSSLLQKAKGIGWSNIQNRVEFLKGTLDIQSADGKGTSVHIELNIV